MSDITKIQQEDGSYLYKVKDIGKYLGLKNIRVSLANHPYDIIKIKCNTVTGPQDTNFLSCEELQKLLCRSNKPKAKDLANILGIEIMSHMRYEQETVGYILEAFDGEEMLLQYKVKKYLIDLYFPQYKLAVECDEGHHERESNALRDVGREREISETLSCSFIRYKPHKKGFSIFKVINQIHRFIRCSPQCQD
jgi:very-short-patch-repair endonuclease